MRNGCNFDEGKKSMVFSTILALLLVDILTEEGTNVLGNIFMTVGQLLLTSAVTNEECAPPSKQYCQ